MKYLSGYDSFKKKRLINEKIVDKTGKVDSKVLEYWNGLYEKWLNKTLNPQEEKDYNNMTMSKLLLLEGSNEKALKELDDKVIRLRWAKQIIEGFKIKFDKEISDATREEISEWNYEFCFQVLAPDNTDYQAKGSKIPLVFTLDDVEELKKYSKEPEKYFKDYSLQLNEYLDEVEIPWEKICDYLNIKEIKSKPESTNIFKRFVKFIWKKIKTSFSWLEKKSVQLVTFLCNGDFESFKSYDDNLREDDLMELINKQKSDRVRYTLRMSRISEIFNTIGDEGVRELKKSRQIKKLSNYKNIDKIARDNQFIINDDIISVSPKGHYLINGEQVEGSLATIEHEIQKKLLKRYSFLEKPYKEGLDRISQKGKKANSEIKTEISDKQKDFFAQYDKEQSESPTTPIQRDATEKEKLDSVERMKRISKSEDRTPSNWYWIWKDYLVKKFIKTTKEDIEANQNVINFIKTKRQENSNDENFKWIWKKEYDVLLEFGFLPIDDREEEVLKRRIRKFENDTSKTEKEKWQKNIKQRNRQI